MSEGFLSRWARRKEAVKAAEQAEQLQAPVPSAQISGLPEIGPLPAQIGQARSGWGGVRGRGGAEGTTSPHPEPPPPPASSPQGGREERAPDARVLGDRGSASEDSDKAENPLADLPSLDALTPETDLTPFLRTGVPSALRNAALRRMWSLDPSIRDFVSEAREYAYDWNTPGGVPGLGPLLPGDDVKAMLGRLFRDPAAEASPEPAALAEAAPEEAREDPTHETSAASPEAADAPDRGDATDGETPALQAPVVTAASVQPTMADTPRPESRLRRHGGAMPG